MLNWIDWNRTVWSFTYELTNDRCLVESFVIHWNDSTFDMLNWIVWNRVVDHLDVCKQKLNLNKCDTTPPADLHYLNQPNYSWPLESSSGSSHLRPGVFHISLPTHKIHNRGGERKRRINNCAWVSSKLKRRKTVTLCSSPCICRLSQECICAKLSQSH